MQKACFLVLLFCASSSYGEPVNSDAPAKVIKIYQDADLTHHVESSRAIQLGIEVAFDEINYEVAGHKVAFEYLNHRGNVIRSKQNYKAFLADPDALAIYSGIHSPPLIKNRTFINNNRALTLVPWAAGGPITRHPSPQNWVFRLSVDDQRAGPVLADFAVKSKGCKSPHLLLENTPWGDSNLVSMSKALAQYGIDEPGVTRFSWNIKEQGARVTLRKILAAQSDCILLVANAIEGAIIVQSLMDVQGNNRLPIISHWGITGGDFHKKISSSERNKVDLHFIQSCFAFTQPQQNIFSKQVFARLQKVSSGNIKTPVDLQSAVGFIHAYDLTRLLISAIEQVDLSGEIEKDRDAVRLAMENLQAPVQGLVKTYEEPFSAFHPETNINAHEALHTENYCMGRFGTQDEILIVADEPI